MDRVDPRAGFADIHSHVLWGIDDGAEEKEACFRMLREAAKDGISLIVCTPHIEPGVTPFDENAFLAAYHESLALISRENLPLRLLPGNEILYTEHTLRFLQEGRIHPLGDTRAVLVEFFPGESESRISEAVRRIGTTGYRPILAHTERYMRLSRISQIRALKEAGAEIQINARTLLRKQPLLRRSYFNSLFEEDLVDYVSTDTHDMPGRETCMTEAYDFICDRYGRSRADALCRDNALELLGVSDFNN